MAVETKVLHTRISVHKRATSRSSATRAAAYRSCSKIQDINTGEIHDFTHKKGLIHQEIRVPVGGPKWAEDRAQLWGRHDKKETRKDAQLARDIVFSLPRQMQNHTAIYLVRQLCTTLFTSKGMVADFAIHDHGDGDKRNKHAHIRLTMRSLEKEGFGNKVRAWNDPRWAESWRKSIAELTNKMVESEGPGKDTVLMDHRSFREQGINKAPERRLSRGLYWLRKSTTIEVRSNTKEVQNERQKLVTPDIQGIQGREGGVIKKAPAKRIQSEGYGFGD